MRDWIKMFEDDFDHAEESRDAAKYAREAHVTELLTQACGKLSLDLSEDQTPVVYDEADNRSAVIRVEGSISLGQLTALAQFGQNIVVHLNPQGYGLLIEMNVSSHLDPNVSSIR